MATTMRRRARTYTELLPPPYDSGNETPTPSSIRSRTRPPSPSPPDSPTQTRSPTRSWPSFPPPLAPMTVSREDSSDDDQDALYMAQRPPPPQDAPYITSRPPPPPSSASRPPPPSTSRPPSSSSSRPAPLPIHRPISTTTPMTETDEDGPVRLPVARKPRLRTATPLDVLFGFARFLSVVPAVFGSLSLIWASSSHHTLDTLTALLFTLLTAYQCLALTSGLLFRWRTYYPPLPTLVRLLALQAICWSATSMTLSAFPVKEEVIPQAVWAFIATCTSISRAVQMWVTSNLWRLETGPLPPALTRPSSLGNGGPKEARWRGGTWRGRRWDWGAVTRRCIVPLGFAYFVMAWAGVVVRWET